MNGGALPSMDPRQTDRLPALRRLQGRFFSPKPVRAY